VQFCVQIDMNLCVFIFILLKNTKIEIVYFSGKNIFLYNFVK